MHLRYINTEVQLPANLESTFALQTGRDAALKLREERAMRFAKGAATNVTPRLTASSEETISAPAALKQQAATTSFSGDPAGRFSHKCCVHGEEHDEQMTPQGLDRPPLHQWQSSHQ